jgi:aryl-alcohol dehydrogenase-like predicted oxidoreductase
MTFGEEWGWGASKDEARKIFDVFVEAGGNYIDTANVYTGGTSERYVGEFIHSEREQIVLATKYSISTQKWGVNACGNHRKNLTQSLEASLKRLGTDYIDLYLVHIWDFMTPVEEVMRALDDMVRAGKVLYVGISDTPGWIVSQANTLADLKGWTPFIGLQVEYSLIQRTPERDLLPMARAFDIGVTAWSPLGGGVLTGKYSKEKQQGISTEGKRLSSHDFFGVLSNDRNTLIAEEVLIIANEIGRSPAQVALNWVRQQKGVIIPIIGARKASQIKDNLGCLDFELTQEQLQRLDEKSKIELGFPYDLLASEFVKNMTYGGTLELIHNHRS